MYALFPMYFFLVQTDATKGNQLSVTCKRGCNTIERQKCIFTFIYFYSKSINTEPGHLSNPDNGGRYAL